MNLEGVQGKRRSQQAYTLAEIVVTAFAFGIMAISLFSGFSSGYAVIQLQRENLRATQIMVQKMETLRLMNWSQVTDTNNYLENSFSDWFNPSATNSGTGRGAYYFGVITTDAPAGVPADYRGNMRAVTVNLYWTNYPIWPQTNKIVRSRSMQTFVARSGMQSYVY